MFFLGRDSGMVSTCGGRSRRDREGVGQDRVEGGEGRPEAWGAR